MTAGETKIQKDYVMEFICRKESDGGLGYRDTSANMVSKDLFIPDQLAEFVKDANKLAWKSLLSNFHNDEDALIHELKDEIKSRLLTASNVATFLNKNSSFSFHGERLQIFYFADTELRGDADFKKNIFSAVKELPHSNTFDGIDEKMRPDISFFVNGIYFGYMELKTNIMGQTASQDGRTKIIGDYLRTIQEMAARKRYRPDDNTVDEDRREALMIFEKAIHLTACDINKLFVWRNVQSYTDDALKAFSDETLTITEYKHNIEKDFKEWPLSSNALSQEQAFKESMFALYSKKMIEKEISIYNFIKYRYKLEKGKKGKKAKKVRTSNTGELITPRPKQKYGCDKIMVRVKEMLDKEKDPDYYIRKLRDELTHIGVAPDRIEDIIEKREASCNNKYVYSLLLQYAAGFGKSNIIGWTALQLRDLRYEGAYAYDKVLIVVDRLQLRDQLDTMMMDMNIDKGMFVEVRNQSTFVKALEPKGGKRIIVVNIQKFLDLREALEKSKKHLEKMRVVFLIDEIHRSVVTDTGDEMIDIFSQLADVIDGEVRSDNKPIKKKNLIIGFTATPTKKVLARFGEFKNAQIVPTWIPFDSYTMRQAIRDGYILDPTKHIIPFKLPMRFDIPDDEDEDGDKEKKVKAIKKKVYENTDRLEILARFIVRRLTTLVYSRIRGYGKAMLAVSSIPVAIKYFRLIKKYMREQCEDESSPFHRYEKAPIAIVYSDRQGAELCSRLNDDKTEEQVIQNFKKERNGIIIVVDKLQTGFDEPYLHTLFLDKEIKGINAIQTISRVDRTSKWKKDCHIVDLSWKNVNVKNIKEAFKEYCDTVISDFNGGEVEKEIEMCYKFLCQSYPYTRWYLTFKNNPDGITLEKMEEDLREWITNEFQEEQKSKQERADTKKNSPKGTKLPEPYLNKARLVREYYGKFYKDIMDVYNIYDINDMYYDETFKAFWLRYCNIYRIINNQFIETEYIDVDVEVDDTIPGITPDDDTDDDSGHGGGSHGLPTGGHSSVSENIRLIIERWNRSEQEDAMEVQKWSTEIQKMFAKMKANSRLMAIVNDDNFTTEYKIAECLKAVSKYKRGLSTSSDPTDQNLRRMINDNAEQLVDMFLQSLKDGDEDVKFYEDVP